MLDLIAQHPHYRVHVDPVWDALPAEARGTVIDRTARQAAQPNAVLLASGADIRRARDLGYTRIALIEHGIGQSYLGGRSPSYPGAPGRQAVSLFLSPNATASAYDRAAYPNARHAIVGDPVVDTIPRRDGPPGRVVAISFHWSWEGIPEMRSAFPHYRDVIPALVKEFELIAHAHPRAAGSLERHYRRAGIEFVPDWRDVCRRADVYVCDTSSTLYEFASTGRPVVVLNAPWYRRDVEHGLRFWEAASVGDQVNEPGELLDTVELALEEYRYHPSQAMPCRTAREAALDIVYQPRTGAAALAATALVGWLAEARAIAA